jgi:hypothetical protein
LKRTLDHDDCRLVQIKVVIEREKETLQTQAKNRYWQLAQAEDLSAEVD